MNTVQELFAYLQKSPTAFHAVEEANRMFVAEGYHVLEECSAWHPEAGEKYVVTRNRSSLIAFTIPKNRLTGFRIVAGHSDSPTYKIKENAEIEVRGKYVQLNTEGYGSMIAPTWLDRPLSVAGRVLVRDGNSIHTVLVDANRDMILIPSVAIHMDRQVNEGHPYKANIDMMPLYGDIRAKNTFRSEIAQLCHAREEDILGSDLYLYNRVPGSVWGKNNEYISAARLDDLECVYASIRAMLNAPTVGHVNVCCIFDNEEVGNRTKQGADSTFFSDVLSRAANAMGADHEEYCRALSNSFMLSADNAHAVHPNHPEYADSGNSVFMNEGIVIKFNANQKYTTDGVSEAVFHAICKNANVPVQHFANRSDLAGGSTLGNISTAHVSVQTLDIGLAQLSMHSAYETAGALDLDYMIRGMTAFYAADIAAHADGEYRV